MKLNWLFFWWLFAAFGVGGLTESIFHFAPCTLAPPILEPMYESPFEGVEEVWEPQKGAWSGPHLIQNGPDFVTYEERLEQRVSALEAKVEELMAPDIEYEIRGTRLWYRLSDGEWREYEPPDYESTAFVLE